MCDSAMNLKLNNEVRSSVNLLHKVPVSSIKEERRRTGRYIAILVGILLLMIAVYHAWVRRIPVVASLVVPALIMFVYVGWVLYTASRDKLKMMDAEAALNAAAADPTEIEGRTSELSNNNIEISVISSKESSRVNSPDASSHKESGVSSTQKGESTSTEQKPFVFIKPIILVNDKPAEDLDQKWSHIVENITNNEKFKGLPTRRKYKRRFVRRRHNVFKRSYSIA